MAALGRLAELMAKAFTVFVSAAGLATAAIMMPTPMHCAAQRGTRLIPDDECVASADGDFELTVMPSDPESGSPADYLLRKQGRTVWQGKRPFSLLEPVLSCRGDAAGFIAGNEMLQLVTLNSKGDMRVLDVFPLPNVRETVDDSLWFSKSDRLVLCGLALEGASRTLRAYSLVDATTRVLPKLSSDTERAARLELVESVPLPAELGLQHWLLVQRHAERTLGLRLVVARRDGSRLWSLDIPNAYQGSAISSLRDILLDGRDHVRLVPEGFEVLIPGEQMVRRFDVHLQSGGEETKGQVLEREALPWRPDQLRKRPLPFEMVTESQVVAPALQQQPSLIVFALDERGRLLGANRNGDTVFLYGSNGRLEAQIQARRDGSYISWLEAIPKSEAILVGYSDRRVRVYSESGDLRASFDDAHPANGMNATRLSIMSSVDSHRWLLGQNSVLLLIAHDTDMAVVPTPVARIRRSPHRRWLRPMLGPLAVSPEGSVAVMETFFDEQSGRSGAVHIYIYDTNGDPVGAVQLPQGLGVAAGLAFDGSRIFVTTQDAMLVLSCEGGWRHTNWQLFGLEGTGVDRPVWRLAIESRGYLDLLDIRSLTRYRLQI